MTVEISKIQHDEVNHTIDRNLIGLTFLDKNLKIESHTQWSFLKPDKIDAICSFNVKKLKK